MKKINILLFGFVALAIPSILASCSDDDNDFTPGPDVAADCPAAYFSNENSSAIVVGSDDSTLVVTVKRADTIGTVTVPIEVEKKVGDLDIPESVTFADGDSVAELIIGFDNYETGMTFTLKIADGYSNPYLIVNGSSSFTGTLTQVNKICDVYYTGRFSSVRGSAIYQYEGINQFMWRNFLGSDIDLTFMVNTTHSGATFDPNNVKTLMGDIVPLDYYYQDEWGYHFVENGTDSTYITWTPQGQTQPVTSFYFYGYYGASYSYILFDPDIYGYGYGYGYFWSAYVNDEGYENIYFYLYY